MKANDYPGVQQSADKASVNAQRYYLNFTRGNLFSSICAAGLAVYNFEGVNHKKAIYIMAAILLLVSLILTVLIKLSNYEGQWYQGRALAESVKTLTWRFVTGSENFDTNLDEHLARQKLTTLIDELEKDFPKLSSILDAEIAARAVISQTMEEIRCLTWPDRLKYYIENRIVEQKGWYSSKSRYNHRMKVFWLWFAILFEFIALICSVVMIVNPGTDWNFVGFFTTLTASIFAWLELKQHESLKQAYTVAAMELAQIEALAQSVNSEAELAKYVLDAENAISREHTMWLAQRRK